MDLKIIKTSPQSDAGNVRSNPLKIEISFNEKVDRDSVEQSVKIDPVPEKMFFSWEEKQQIIKNTDNSAFGSHTIGTLVKYDVLTIAVIDRDRGYTFYTVTIDKKTPKGLSGNKLAADFKLTFRTRAQTCDILPENAKGGDSRPDIKPGEYKRAIVLSGGGAKGAFQVGVLKYLYEVEGFYPDVLIGTSVGAINVLKLAEAATVQEHKTTLKELEESWMKIRFNRDVLEEVKELKVIGEKMDDPTKMITNELNLWDYIGGALLPVVGGLFVADAVEDAVEKLMKNIDALRKRSGLHTFAPLEDNITNQRFKANVQRVVNNKKIEAYVGVTELNTGRSSFLDKDKTGDFLKAVIASASMPVVFETVKIGEDVYVDGGVKDVAGLAYALSMGATDIVVIPTYRVGSNPHLPKLNDNRYNGFEDVLNRSILDLVFDEVLANDIQGTIHKQTCLNHFAGQDKRIRVIDPEHLFNDTLTFNPESAKRNIQYGQMRAKNVIEKVSMKEVQHPCQQTGTASYLVIQPSMKGTTGWHDPAVLHEHTGGLSEVLAKSFIGNVRIIIKEGNDVVHTYPNDFLNAYSNIVVPGSDPEMISPLNPYLKGKRKGQFYAFPLHANNDGAFNISTSSKRPTKLNVEMIVSDVDNNGKYTEVRTNVNVDFNPDKNGIMLLPLEVPSMKKVAPSNTVSLQMAAKVFNKKKENSPDTEAQEYPRLVIHGYGAIPDLSLTGHDGKLDKGRWESSRDMKLIEGFNACSVLALNTEVILFENTGFTGKKMTIRLSSVAVNSSSGMTLPNTKIEIDDKDFNMTGNDKDSCLSIVKNLVTKFGTIRSIKVNRV